MARYIQDAGLPIIVDETDNRYYLVHTRPDGVVVRALIYHCFFCGGAIAPSRG
jgi:hypothetical protein